MVYFYLRSLAFWFTLIAKFLSTKLGMCISEGLIKQIEPLGANSKHLCESDSSEYCFGPTATQ